MVMRNETLEYLYQHDGWLVSPIWPGRMAFPFLTMHHVAFCEAMGFESFQATPVLRQVVPDAIRDEAHFDEIVERRYFDYSYFEKELEQLEAIKKLDGLKGGGVFGPLTITSDLLGAERMLKLVRRNPAFVHKILDYVTEFMIELAQMEVEHGADFFWFAEPCASLLHQKYFIEFSGQYMKRVYDSVDVPGWLHVCGPTLKHTKYMESIGVQVLSIDYMTDLASCVRMVDENTIIMGNVSPSDLLLESADVIEDVVREKLASCKNYKNLIVSTGCAMMEGTSKENMSKLFSVTEQFQAWTNKEFRQIRALINLMLDESDIDSFVRENNVSASVLEAAKEEYPLVLAAKRSGGYLA